MIAMYNVQQSIKKAMSFCFEVRIRYDRVVAGHEGEGDVAPVGSLRDIVQHAFGMREFTRTYSRVYDAGCLHKYDLLQELDAAYAHTGGGLVHASQDAGFD
jgi:hypothetical protein